MFRLPNNYDLGYTQNVLRMHTLHTSTESFILKKTGTRKTESNVMFEVYVQLSIIYPSNLQKKICKHSFRIKITVIWCNLFKHFQNNLQCLGYSIIMISDTLKMLYVCPNWTNIKLICHQQQILHASARCKPL